MIVANDPWSPIRSIIHHRKHHYNISASETEKQSCNSPKKNLLLYSSFLPCFSKGINVLKPTFWTIANICPRLSPFSRRLQYLFFGFRKRDNTSKKTWKSPLLDCLSALRNFPFRFPLSFLLAFQLPKQMETMMMTMIKPSIFPIEWTQKIVSRALKLDYVTHAEKLSWLSNFSSILESFMVIYIKLESILKIAQNVVKIRISIIIGTFLD